MPTPKLESVLARRLREIFKSTVSIVDERLKDKENNIKHSPIPEKNREYVIVYATKNMIRFDCIARSEEETFFMEEDYGEDSPQRRETLSSGFKRNANVVEHVKKRAKGVCQLCGEKAPFFDKQGNPYLEVHHVIWLSKD